MMMTEIEKPEFVCVFCDRGLVGTGCWHCNEYKGVMTLAEWEAYTGQVWEE
jgi:hypothetical protein